MQELSTKQQAGMQEGNTPPAPDVAPPKGLADKLGDWAFKHKKFFESATGSLIFRNALRTIVAIAPYAVVNAGVYQAFANTMNRPGANALGRFKPMLTDRGNILQNWAIIGLSFTVFRTTSKVWDRNYDRIFGAKTADESRKAVHDLSKNAIHDIKDISPIELGATGVSALTLAAIRSGIHNPPGTRNSFRRDWAANALGYATFFDLTGRLYDSMAHERAATKRDQQPAESAKVTPELHLKNDKSHDSFEKVVFRNAGSVVGAAVPYLVAQRYANKLTGGTKYTKSYGENLGAVLLAFEIPFAIFTAGIEAWQRGYDKLTGYKPLVEQLEVKYRKDDKARPQKLESHVAMVDKSRADGGQASAISL